MIKKYLLIWIACMWIIPLQAQDTVLSLNQFLNIVKEYHPLALQAGLNSQRAKMVMRQALGGFDPKLELNSERKIFGGKTYFDYLVPEVKLPLWYGVDLKTSYTSYKGDYVNPENKVPSEGLSYFGLSLPLGRGLFIDERRAALKQAGIFKDQAENEQGQMLNDLFMSATQAYAEWLNAWMNKAVYDEAVRLAEIRFNGTKMLYQKGDKPAIDTLETLSMLQSRQQKLYEYQTALVNKKNYLASFLWLDNLTPVDAEKLKVLPDTNLVFLLAPDSLLVKRSADVISQNLEVKAYQFKLRQLDIERRLKLEEIKPTLNVNMGVLNYGQNAFKNINPDYFADNQKLGLTFSMPLTFTKQRAAYSLSKIKLKDAELALSDKQNQTTVKWNNYLNDYLNFNTQISLNKQIWVNNQKLLAGEEYKFRMGESSVFLVNSREQKVLETQEKLNDLYAKRLKTIQYLRWLSNSF